MYATGKIYKVCVSGSEFIYIGSTKNTLEKRLGQHKDSVKSATQTKSACSILFEDGNKPYIELIENYPCNSKLELEKRERYWLEQHPSAVNKNTPTRTWQERWLNNRDHNIEKHKEWLVANKESEAQKRKDIRAALTQEERTQLDKDSYARRRDTLLAKKKERVNCPICDKEMNRNSIYDHNKNIHPT